MMMLMYLLLLLPGLFCIARAVQDFRDRRHGWGAAGVVSALIIFLPPLAMFAFFFAYSR